MSLKTLELHQQADTEGVVRLVIPLDRPQQHYRLIVVVEAESDAPKRQWSEGFFERTYGKWHGELERAPQGEFEKREEF